MKPVIVREVRSMQIHCDRVGNLLLAKFTCKGARDFLVFFPAAVVFWLLDNVPPTKHTFTAPPHGMPTISREDWSLAVPRVERVLCQILGQGLRLKLELDARADLTLMLNPYGIELMRQLMLAYRGDLLDVGM